MGFETKLLLIETLIKHTHYNQKVNVHIINLIKYIVIDNRVIYLVC